MQPTMNDIIAFVNAQPGQTFHTTSSKQSPFTVTFNGRSFVYTLCTKTVCKQSQNDMGRLLQAFAGYNSSLKPSDYHYPLKPRSRFSPYFARLMTAFQNS